MLKGGLRAARPMTSAPIGSTGIRVGLLAPHSRRGPRSIDRPRVDLALSHRANGRCRWIWTDLISGPQLAGYLAHSLPVASTGVHRCPAAWAGENFERSIGTGRQLGLC